MSGERQSCPNQASLFRSTSVFNFASHLSNLKREWLAEETGYFSLYFQCFLALALCVNLTCLVDFFIKFSVLLILQHNKTGLGALRRMIFSWHSGGWNAPHGVNIALRYWLFPARSDSAALMAPSAPQKGPLFFHSPLLFFIFFYSSTVISDQLGAHTRGREERVGN